MTILAGKRLLITGIANDDSIAFATARRAQELGAEVALSAFPRDLETARAAAAGLPAPAPIHPADLTDPDDLARLGEAITDAWGGLDGALHAVAFAPRDALGGDFVDAGSASVELAFRTSAHSFATLAGTVAPLFGERGGSLVGLDFDAGRAWPVYNWMGVCKAALESVNRYLARDLGAGGTRVNLVAAGPIHTRAAGGIPAFERLLESWERSAPLAWDPRDTAPVADAVCFLFSDLARAVTGEILHVDGGHHAMAA